MGSQLGPSARCVTSQALESKSGACCSQRLEKGRLEKIFLALNLALSEMQTESKLAKQLLPSQQQRMLPVKNEVNNIV